MKKIWLICALVLSVITGQVAIAEGVPEARYEGRWVAVRESFLRVYLPDGWTVAPREEMPSGLLARAADGGVELRISLAPAQEREMDEIIATCEENPDYAMPVQLYEEGAYPWALMGTEDGSGIIAVTETGMVFTVTAAFQYQGEEEAEGRALSLEILRTLSENPENNG